MPSNLPFQPEEGIHTSNLISESLVGLITPVTRQKAGRALKGAAEPAGGVNAPAATGCAAVIVVFASLRSPSFSQDCALAGFALNAAAPSNATVKLFKKSL